MDESEIPIDIHSNKLMEWLVSRRHVPRDWQTKVYVVRQKINDAIKDMPVHEGIATLLSGSYINYYHCIEIVKILEETESSSKNFFGQYGSQRMKDWREVIRLYEKDNVYLGEMASLLLRNVNYEIPALRKQIQKFNQQVAEYDRKEIDYEKQANSARNEVQTIFKELGIEGKNVRVELLKKAADLPKMNKKIAADARALDKAVQFYSNVVNALTGGSRQVLKPLKFLLEKGDVTVYEWKSGTAPTSVEATELNFDSIDEKVDDEDTIDFDLDVDLDVGGDADIDWGISANDAESSTDKDDSGTARGVEARSVLGHPDTRASITNDVLELEAFLKLRLYELRADGGAALTSLPDILLSTDDKQVSAMVDAVSGLLKHLNNPTALHYVSINTNPSYVDQLCKKLTQKQKTYEKLIASKHFVKLQRAETAKEAEAVEPKVQLVISKTHQLQELIEKDISKKYNGRPVNLMGGVNTL